MGSSSGRPLLWTLAAACILLIGAASAAEAGSRSCVTGAPEFAADDLAEIAALKAQIDGACRCEDYDGSARGKKRNDFVRCANQRIRQAVRAGSLRRSCSRTVLQIYAVSSCGLPSASSPGATQAPCIQRMTRNGSVTCSIRPVERCLDHPRGAYAADPCPEYRLCLDAADDNGNFLFVRDPTGGDDGTCGESVRDPVCGDGLLDAAASEECDDGNTLSGDGCSATCRHEAGAALPIESGEEWVYAKGTQEPPSGWKQILFDDSQWLRGPTPIGYNECGPATPLPDMRNNYSSVYMRHLFDVHDPAALDGLLLTIDYDDSFVAYLNGQEVARSNVQGNPPERSRLAVTNHECSGGNPANPPEQYAIEPGLLRAGINVLTLQGHNLTLGSSDFVLAPTLSASRCGNHVVEAGELCDGDTSVACSDEFGHAGTRHCLSNCSGYTACEASPFCGDSLVQESAGEVCDSDSRACVDAWGYPGDQVCNEGCTGFAGCHSSLFCGDGLCTSPPESSLSCSGDCPAACGNTLREPGEECDDGNTTSGDGCSAACVVEFCGDGIVNNNDETCDDGAQNGEPNHCNSECSWITDPVCGNGVQEGGEECDDGGSESGDGCSQTCTVELPSSGFVCDYQPRVVIGEIDNAPYTWHGPGPNERFGASGGNGDSPLHENSGWVQSRKNPDVFWGHNDNSPDKRIFAIHRDGTYLGTWWINVPVNAVDPEDIAIGPDPEDPDSGVYYLYLGDIGDNPPDNRSNLKVWRILEPDVDPEQDFIAVANYPADVITLQYPPSHTQLRDSESLMVDPWNGDLYLVTKRTNPAMVYRAAYPQSFTETNVMEKVADLFFGGNDQALGADISENGELIAIRRQYGSAARAEIWERPPGTPLWEALAGTPCTVTGLYEVQGEAIAFDIDNSGSFYTVSENNGGGGLGYTPHYYYQNTIGLQ